MNDQPELAGALQASQQTLAALQKLQEQTVQLHKQFLEQQEQAQRTLLALVQHQQALLTPGLKVSTPLPAALPPLPPPVVVPPPPAPVVVVAPVVPPSAPRSVVPPPPPPAPVAAATTTTSTSTAIDEVLLGVVSEKTGYPAGMLTLDMSLDADLGVDSIKRVEILSALQDRLPAAPVVKPEHLGRLHTLRDVATFLATGGDPPAPSVNGSAPTVHVPPQQATPSELFRTVLNEATTADSVAQVLLGVVSEKTGYPAGMLTLDMSLDADLGVDSIKRVEILSALQDRLPAAPVVKPEHLGRLHTLRDVATFLAAGGDEPPPSLPLSSEMTAPKTEQVEAIRMAAMSESALARHLSPAPTEAPPSTIIAGDGLLNARPVVVTAATDMIDRSILQAVDIALSAPRPVVPLPAGCEVWVVAAPDDPFAKELVAHLTQLRYAPRSWTWVDPAIPMASGNPAAVVLVAPPKVSGIHLNRLAVRWLQHAAAKLRQAARQGCGLFATVSRLDGAFGLTDLAPAADPASGGLAGLVKTVRNEWPEVATKALDVDPNFANAYPAKAAVAVVEELLLAGPVEVGVTATHRIALELARTVRKSTASSGLVAFGPKDVILLTGGARGVTAEVAVALATIFRPTLVLTGRTPPPTGPEPEWSVGITDEAHLKSAVATQMGSAATPKAVGEAVQKLLAQREIRATLDRVERAGGKAVYQVADVADSRQVADLLRLVQAKHGPITGLVHGAGVLSDRRIEELTPDQFDAVYTTKVNGLRNLLDPLATQELKAIVLFSSTTARLGRTGQLAYAVANEVLNKTAQVEARRRPNARVVAINWGPWEGGMVTPALKRLFEAEGVGLIPLAEGGHFAVQELNAPGRAVEVIALGKHRPATKSNSGVMSVTAAVRGGSGVLPAPAAPPATNPPATNPPPPEMTSVFERAVELSTHPVLRSHVIDGRAVLPMALHMEWLAHAALHGNPGLVFHGFNEIRVTNGVMVEDGGATPVRALAGRAVKKDGGQFHVPVELRGKRRDGRDVIHSRGEVVLASALPKPPTIGPAPVVQPYPHPLDEIYRYFLFHGPDLHGIERIEGVAEAAFVGTVYPAPTPNEWFDAPLRGAWVMDPLVLDASFQMMILWSYAQHGAGSLPCFAGRYRQFRRSFPAGPCRVVVRVTRDNGSFARADMDYLDPADNAVVAQIQDYECVIDPQLNQAFRRNRLIPKVKV